MLNDWVSKGKQVIDLNNQSIVEYKKGCAGDIAAFIGIIILAAIGFFIAGVLSL